LAVSLAVLHSRALWGFDAPPVTVEVRIAGGLPAFNLVGLPDAEVRESRDRVREVLREPLESGRIHISRAARQASFPARFQFVAAMNPCPCGSLGHPSGKCRCTPDQIARYCGRISGPLLDRINLQIEVPSLPAGALPARPGQDS
jgi:magnesium chelatase family protein